MTDKMTKGPATPEERLKNAELWVLGLSLVAGTATALLEVRKRELTQARSNLGLTVVAQQPTEENKEELINGNSETNLS